MHHSDGRFLSGWNHGLSSTGFLCGGEEKQRGICQSSGAPCKDRNRAYVHINSSMRGRTSNPVDGDAFHPTDAGGDDVLPPRLITLGPRNPVQSHVRPVHSVIACQRGEKERTPDIHPSQPEPKTNIIKTCWTWSGPPLISIQCKTMQDAFTVLHLTASPCSAVRSDSRIICTLLYSLAFALG